MYENHAQRFNHHFKVQGKGFYVVVVLLQSFSKVQPCLFLNMSDDRMNSIIELTLTLNVDCVNDWFLSISIAYDHAHF